jgi:hypothetical protein
MPLHHSREGAEEMSLDQILVIVAALIAAVAGLGAVGLTAFLGLLTYPKQKEIDRREDLRKERAKAYAEYLAAYAEAARLNGVKGKEEEFAKAQVNYNQKYSALFNLADNNVLTPTTAFHNFLYEETSNLPPEDWAREWITRYTEMLVQMREDAFVGESTVTENEIANSLPWYFEWQPGTPDQVTSLQETATS